MISGMTLLVLIMSDRIEQVVLDCLCGVYVLYIFFFKQKTAYEMRISDWSSDVCSSDLRSVAPCACAQSSTSHSPFSSASARSASMSQGQPARCTHIIARLRGYSMRRTDAGSILLLTGSMSAKTGVAPTATMQAALAKKLREGRITSYDRKSTHLN